MTSRAKSLMLGAVAAITMSACGSNVPDDDGASDGPIVNSQSASVQGDWELVGVFDAGVDINVALGKRQFAGLFYDNAVAVLTCDVDGEPAFHLVDSNGAQRPAPWTKDRESGQYTVELALSSSDRYTIESLTAAIGDSSAEWDLSYGSEEFDWPESVLTEMPFNLAGVDISLSAGTLGPFDGPWLVERVTTSSELSDGLEYEATVEWPGIYGEAASRSYDLRDVSRGWNRLGDGRESYDLVPVLSVMSYRGKKILLELPTSGDDAVNDDALVNEIADPKLILSPLGREVLCYGVHMGSGGSGGDRTDIRFYGEGLELVDGHGFKAGDFVFKVVSTNFGEMVRWRTLGDGSIEIAYEMIGGGAPPNPLLIELDFREVVEYERATVVIQGSSYTTAITPSSGSPELSLPDVS